MSDHDLHCMSMVLKWTIGNAFCGVSSGSALHANSPLGDIREMRFAVSDLDLHCMPMVLKATLRNAFCGV